MSSAEGSSDDAVGGYDYEFVEETDEDLKCGTCTLVYKDPQFLTCCSNRVCLSCLKKCMDSICTKGNCKICPYCRKSVCFNPTACKECKEAVLDREKKNKIDSLLMRCPNCKQGCEEKLQLQQLMGHLKECYYEEITCPNGCQVKGIYRKDMSDHLSNACLLRLVKCDYCSKDDIKANVLSEHRENCNKRPVKCLYCDTPSLVQEILMEHQEQCPFMPVDCSYRPYGCEGLFPRSETDQHMKENALNHVELLEVARKEIATSWEVENIKYQKTKKELEKLRTGVRSDLQYYRDIHEVFLNSIKARCQLVNVSDNRNDPTLLRMVGVSTRRPWSSQIFTEGNVEMCLEANMNAEDDLIWRIKFTAHSSKLITPITTKLEIGLKRDKVISREDPPVHCLQEATITVPTTNAPSVLAISRPLKYSEWKPLVNNDSLLWAIYCKD